ncbi:circularly permuted type 2 ATP-grasp protein, partial [candidate division KSB1 bacterium]|nr:circularly permuted type 2 ATP-grasp protein [candidate division KSB1 bacterium]
IADPRELDYSGSRLRKGDFEIDLVYRRVLTQEFLEKLDEVQPMLQAYRDRNVCMVNSFRTKMLHKKSVFAILSDSRNAGYFSAGERRVIDAHIPWTRLISDCKTDFHGETIDLLNYISRNRENLVIKPNDEYGGKGVVIGWETSQEAWEKAVQSAQDDVWVVQEKVPLAKEVFAYYEDGLQFKELLVDLDPFLFGVNVAGFLTRLSTSSLANVTAGGGATVTFIIEEV